MENPRRAYPSDVTDEEWAFAAPYLTLMKEDAPQREHSLREVFNALRWITRTGAQWRFLPNDLPPWAVVNQQAQRWLKAGCFEAMAADLRAILRLVAGREELPSAVILDSRTLQSTPESGARAGFDGHKKRKGSKVHAAVDTLGHLLTLRVTAANAQDRAQVATLTAAVREATGQSVQVAYVDQGYTGAEPAQAAADAPASDWRSSSWRRPSVASSCCPGAGWWRGVSPGRPAFADWRATSSGCPPPWPACTTSPSSVSCSASWITYSKVHDSL